MRDGGGGSERAVPAAFAVLDVSSLALPPQPSSPPGAVCAVSAAGGSARVGSLGGAGLVSASWREEVAVALSKASASRGTSAPGRWKKRSSKCKKVHLASASSRR